MRLKKVSFGRLASGMLYYSQFDPNSHLGGIGVKSGSAHDPPGKRGLAHHTEHVLFGESAKHSRREVELNYYERFMGGPDEDANIRTDYVSTFYGHDSLLWRPHLTECFDMIANLVLHPQIGEAGVLLEKAAVHNEYYLNGVDSPYELVRDRLNAVLYDKNPVRNRIDCELPEFESVTVKDVRSFIRRYYVPKNMFIILFGPAFADVKKTAEKYFEGWGQKTTPTLDYDHSDDFPQLTSIKSGEMVFPGIHQFHLGMGFPTETFGSKDSEALDVLARIWAFRLRVRLRHENCDFHKGVYRVFVVPERTHLHGLLRVWFATVSGEFAKEAEEIILEEAKKLREELVLADELEAMRKNMEWKYRDAFKNVPGKLAEMVIESAANGDEELEGLHSFIPNLQKVNRKRILEVANKYLTPNYARYLVRPGPGKVSEVTG